MSYGAKWKDISSFSQGDKERTPNSFELRPNGHVRLAVHRHRSAPTTWHLTCAPWFDTHPLRAEDANTAKRYAVEMVRDRASALLADLRDAD